MSTPPLLPSTIALVMPWREMSTLVRYAIVVECDKIIFTDGSIVRRCFTPVDKWVVVGDERTPNWEPREALLFAAKSCLPVELWKPSPALVAKAMDELRKRRARG